MVVGVTHPAMNRAAGTWRPFGDVAVGQELVQHGVMDSREELENGWITDTIRAEIEASEATPALSFDDVDSMIRFLRSPSRP